MQVNRLEAKNQLSKLVKASLAGEELIIASHGKAQVKLAPSAAQVDAAFSEAVDQVVGQLMGI